MNNRRIQVSRLYPVSEVIMVLSRDILYHFLGFLSLISWIPVYLLLLLEVRILVELYPSGMTMMYPSPYDWNYEQFDDFVGQLTTDKPSLLILVGMWDRIDYSVVRLFLKHLWNLVRILLSLAPSIGLMFRIWESPLFLFLQLMMLLHSLYSHSVQWM